MENMTPDSLLYPIADALNMPLHEMENKIRGFEVRKLNIGPWRLDADVSVISDYLSERTASFFVKVLGNLWLYMVSKYDKPLVAYVVDGGICKLHVKDCAAIKSHASSSTLARLKAGLITAYYFDEKTKVWIEDASYLSLATTSGVDQSVESKDPLLLSAPAETIPPATS